MENPTPDFPPLTPRQLELLKAIKTEKEKLKNLPPCDPKTLMQVPEFYEIQERINDLSVKALRSGLLKGRPAESRRPGLLLVFDSTGEYAKILAGFGDFHPDLEPWALNHFIEWRRNLPLQRYDARDILRETGIISIETGIKSPIDFEDIERRELIKRRVLELRGAKDIEDEDDDMTPQMSPAVTNGPTLNTSGEKIEKYRGIVVTDEMLKVAKWEYKARPEKKRKRTRKTSATWDMVIDKLVEENLLPTKITRQAFRKWLKNHFPDYPWEKV